MKRILLMITKVVAVLLSIAFSAMMLVAMLFDNTLAQAHSYEPYSGAVTDQYNAYAQQKLDEAQAAALGVDKQFWLLDDDRIAPKPDSAKYGSTTDPSELGWLFDEAAELLDGQDTIFTTETVLAPGTEAIYYLDDTIFAVTWKQGIDNGMYTFSEVKIAHASQIRRYHSGGEYNTGSLQVATDMARYVNAVVASGADYYAFRNYGIVVLDGVVHRVDPWCALDTCYIDENGDMLFSYRGQFKTIAAAQEFVDANNIRFSISFGPVLKDHDREYNDFTGYIVGEPNDTYARAALCQKGKLHYLVAVLNKEGIYPFTDTLYGFAENIRALGVDTAYTLDGGQTAVVITQNKLINRPVKGYQRVVSDIFYFATAIPDGN